MYDTILVPTDGSDHAVRAAEHARSLARAFDATVHVLHVVDARVAAGEFDAWGVDDEFVGRLETAGQEYVDAVVELVDDGADVRTAMVQGEPSEAILDYASANEVDLLAMGTHGRTGLHRYVAGSVTERVLRLAEAPVLTARATERSHVGDGYQEILVPTDGSEYAEVAVDHALAVAGRFDARVHAVNVVNVVDVALTPDYSLPAEVIEHLHAAGEAATERIAERARDAGLEAVTEVHEGYPVRELLDYVAEHDVDLVTMGTAGRTGVGRYLLGSTTERVVRRSEVPVLAVNARE